MKLMHYTLFHWLTLTSALLFWVLMLIIGIGQPMFYLCLGLVGGLLLAFMYHQLDRDKEGGKNDTQ